MQTVSYFQGHCVHLVHLHPADDVGFQRKPACAAAAPHPRRHGGHRARHGGLRAAMEGGGLWGVAGGCHCKHEGPGCPKVLEGQGGTQARTDTISNCEILSEWFVWYLKVIKWPRNSASFPKLCSVTEIYRLRSFLYFLQSNKSTCTFRKLM